MTNDLTAEERRELDEFIEHLETLTEDDFQIVETKVHTFPTTD